MYLPKQDANQVHLISHSVEKTWKKDVIEVYQGQTSIGKQCPSLPASFNHLTALTRYAVFSHPMEFEFAYDRR